jgi:hypothetical protein
VAHYAPQTQHPRHSSPVRRPTHRIVGVACLTISHTPVHNIINHFPSSLQNSSLHLPLLSQHYSRHDAYLKTQRVHFQPRQQVRALFRLLLGTGTHGTPTHTSVYPASGPDSYRCIPDTPTTELLPHRILRSKRPHVGVSGSPFDKVRFFCPSFRFCRR